MTTSQFPANLLERTQPAFAVILEYDGTDLPDDLPCDYDLPALPPVGSTVTVSTVRGGTEYRFRLAAVELSLYPFNRDHGTRAFYTLKLAKITGFEER